MPNFDLAWSGSQPSMCVRVACAYVCVCLCVCVCVCEFKVMVWFFDIELFYDVFHVFILIKSSCANVM